MAAEADALQAGPTNRPGKRNPSTPTEKAQIRKVNDSQQWYQLQPWGTEPSGDVTPRVFGIPVYITANLPSAQTVGTSMDARRRC